MALSEQSQDLNETENFSSSSNATLAPVVLENSRQISFRQWPPLASQSQTSHPQMTQPNVSVQNYYFMQPYPNYDINGFPFYPPLHASSSSIMPQGQLYSQQIVRRAHPAPSLLPYHGSSTMYPRISRHSSQAASLSNRIGSTHVPAISDISNPEIVNLQRNSYSNAAGVALNSVNSEIRSSTIGSSSNNDQLVSAKMPSLGDTILERLPSNEETMQNLHPDAANTSILDEFLADNEWKSSASSRILQDLLLDPNEFAGSGAGKDRPQDIAPVYSISSPVTETLDYSATNPTQSPTVSGPSRNSIISPPPGSLNALMPQTPIYLQPPVTTPSSANANRSTIARDVLRALRPASVKRKRTENEHSPSLTLSQTSKKARIEDAYGLTSRGPITNMIPPMPSTSVAYKSPSLAQNSYVTRSNFIPALSNTQSGDRTSASNNDFNNDIFVNPSLVLDNIMEDHLGCNSLSMLPVTNGHITADGPQNFPPLSTPLSSFGLFPENRQGEVNDVQLSFMLEHVSPITDQQTMEETTIIPFPSDADVIGQKPSPIDRETSLSQADPFRTFHDIFPTHSEEERASNSLSLSLPLDTTVKNRIPLFLPSETPSPTEGDLFFGKLPTSVSTKLPIDEPPVSVSPIRSRGLVPSNRRPYVLVPRPPNFRINKSMLLHSKGRRKRIAEPNLVEVEESRCRLTERHCLWRGCSAILDSAEKLIKHTKIVHGGVSNANFYVCRWAGCSRLVTHFTPEDLTRHLKGHVDMLITCPYKGCIYETDQGGKLVGHIAIKHDQQDVLKPLALPNRSSPLQPVIPLEVCPAYYSVPIPVTARPISRERHSKLEPMLRAQIIGKLDPKKRGIGMEGLMEDFSLLTDYDLDFFQQEEIVSRVFRPLRLMSPIIKEIDVLEGSLLDGVVIMRMGYDHDGASEPDLAAEVGTDTSFRDVDINEGLGIDLGPNLLQAPREEHDFLEVEALL